MSPSSLEKLAASFLDPQALRDATARSGQSSAGTSAPRAAGSSAAPPPGAPFSTAHADISADTYALAQRACPLLFGAPQRNLGAPALAPGGTPLRPAHRLRAELASRGRGLDTPGARWRLSGGVRDEAYLARKELDDPLALECRDWVRRTPDEERYSLAADRRTEPLAFDTAPWTRHMPDPESFALPELSLTEKLEEQRLIDSYNENMGQFVAENAGQLHTRKMHYWDERYRRELREDMDTSVRETNALHDRMDRDAVAYRDAERRRMDGRRSPRGGGGDDDDDRRRVEEEHRRIDDMQRRAEAREAQRTEEIDRLTARAAETLQYDRQRAADDQRYHDQAASLAHQQQEADRASYAAYQDQQSYWANNNR